MEDKIYCEQYARELALTFMFSFYFFRYSLNISRATFPGNLLSNVLNTDTKGHIVTLIPNILHAYE